LQPIALLQASLMTGFNLTPMCHLAFVVVLSFVFIETHSCWCLMCNNCTKGISLWFTLVQNDFFYTTWVHIRNIDMYIVWV
jgi:hypothetical protein